MRNENRGKRMEKKKMRIACMEGQGNESIAIHKHKNKEGLLRSERCLSARRTPQSGEAL
jgi:hypothetical protein